MKKMYQNDSSYFLQMTVPLSPVLLPGQTTCQMTKRLRPQDALDIHHMNTILKQSTLATFGINKKPWSLISVYSPYSPLCHVMLMETGHRYIPSPEWAPDIEGNMLMQLWAQTLNFMSRLEKTDTYYAGYNWSPRSWGLNEEKGGFQSIPTKWHAMLWSWPPFPEFNEETAYAKWLDQNDMPQRAQRIFCCNNYIDPLSQAIIEDLDQGGTVMGLPSFATWKHDERGIVVPINHSLLDLLTKPEFFSKGFKPLAVRLNQFFCRLTEAFTNTSCRETDELLAQIEKRKLSGEEINQLRAAPKLKSMDEIDQAFQKNKWDHKLLDVLISPIRNRCLEKGRHHTWWRKGFGYSLVLKSRKDERKCELRIMPGVYLGPGGVVEAQGVLLKRPTDQFISKKAIQEKSHLLWELTSYLKKHFDEFERN